MCSFYKKKPNIVVSSGCTHLQMFVWRSFEFEEMRPGGEEERRSHVVLVWRLKLVVGWATRPLLSRHGLFHTIKTRMLSVSTDCSCYSPVKQVAVCRSRYSTRSHLVARRARAVEKERDASWRLRVCGYSCCGVCSWLWYWLPSYGLLWFHFMQNLPYSQNPMSIKQQIYCSAREKTESAYVSIY